jgi:RNA-directed DNA polymerase
MNATATPAYEWKDLPWKAIQRRVFELQTRIYRASGRGDVKTVHKLQRLLVKSWSARCLAIRRVTQDNQGKKTAGVDGVKSLTPPQRLQLVPQLSLTRKARPVRRVWIPKPHAPAEQRPLGIPVMHDRASQALVKLALEPEWEAKFEPNSYGFRPGRSCHDAIGAIFLSLHAKAKYVLDADIAKCFDRINHMALLEKLHTSPTFRRAIRAWLRAGVMDGATLFPTEEGVPQGGSLSPLLANVALHGLETAIDRAIPARLRSGERWRPSVVVYADDLVVLHPDRGIIEQIQDLIIVWLRDLGLELKPSKTQIVHSLEAQDGRAAGFDFLGFTVRQFPSGKAHSARRVSHGQTQWLGFKTLIKPSQAGGKDHQRHLNGLIRQGQAAPQATLIQRLNPVIRGWSAYYSAVVSKATFKKQDYLLFLKLRRWAGRRHSHRTRQRWQKYWHHGWRFEAISGQKTVQLRTHASVPIKRHAKVAGARSPYDGDWVYWSSRMGSYPEVAPQIARLLRRQQGRCGRCGLFFQAGDQIENDHVIPKAAGGHNGDDNRQLLHRHCHDTKSAHETGQTTEEPYEAKVSRTECAVRRVVTSPTQSGSTRRRCLGYQLT